MNSFTRILFFLFFFPIGSVSFGASALVEKINQTFHELPGFVSSFKQMNHDPLSEKIKRSEGNLYFLSPGLMRWEYVLPEEQLIIFGREKIWVYDSILNNVSIQDIQQTNALSALRFLRDENALVEDFTLAPPQDSLVKYGSQEDSLFLTPTFENDYFKMLEIVFDKETHMISQIAIFGNRGEMQILELLDVRVQKNDAALFSFTIIEGMEVIEE